MRVGPQEGDQCHQKRLGNRFLSLLSTTRGPSHSLPPASKPAPPDIGPVSTLILNFQPHNSEQYTCVV